MLDAAKSQKLQPSLRCMPTPFHASRTLPATCLSVMLLAARTTTTRSRHALSHVHISHAWSPPPRGHHCTHMLHTRMQLVLQTGAQLAPAAAVPGWLAAAGESVCKSLMTGAPAATAAGCCCCCCSLRGVSAAATLPAPSLSARHLSCA